MNVCGGCGLTFSLGQVLGRKTFRDFSSSPVVKTLHFQCRGLIPGWGTIIPHVAWPKKENNE